MVSDWSSSKEVTSDFQSFLLLRLKGLRSSLNSALLPVDLSVLSPPKISMINFGQFCLALPSDSRQALLLECNHNITQYFSQFTVINQLEGWSCDLCCGYELHVFWSSQPADCHHCHEIVSNWFNSTLNRWNNFKEIFAFLLLNL